MHGPSHKLSVPRPNLIMNTVLGRMTYKLCAGAKNGIGTQNNACDEASTRYCEGLFIEHAQTTMTSEIALLVELQVLLSIAEASTTGYQTFSALSLFLPVAGGGRLQDDNSSTRAMYSDNVYYRGRKNHK